jgi:tRNA-dihydrouridine synthase B
MIETVPEEKPVAVQLFGHDPETLRQAGEMLAETERYDMIDLNMGCPVPKVVSRGAGAALMRNPSLVEQMVKAVADRVDIPVTAKTRAGWSEQEINALEVCRAIENGGGKAVAVHARLRSSKHEGEPMLDLLADIKSRLSIPVFGNGGIMAPEDALHMFERTGVDGVMLGRGALGNPWIFRQINQLLSGEKPSFPSDTEIRDTIELHLRQTIQMFERRGYNRPQHHACAYFRQQITRYVKGRRGAKAVLRRMNEMVDVPSIMRILDEDLFNQG